MEKRIELALFALVFIAVAVFAIELSKINWNSTKIDSTNSNPVPLIALLSGLEAVAFSIGIIFLFLGWKYAKNITLLPIQLKLAAFFSMGWLLLGWWPKGILTYTADSLAPQVILTKSLFNSSMIIAILIIVYTTLIFLKSSSNQNIPKTQNESILQKFLGIRD
ncbi:MAG: hypothetical protein Q7S21_01725 [archaeon]|nr:hypothetical protein [archaeon]